MATLAKTLERARNATKRVPTMPAHLAAEGFALHFGGHGDHDGSYWWTLLRAGWTAPESSRPFRDYRAVINSAQKTLDKEMSRPVNVRWE